MTEEENDDDLTLWQYFWLFMKCTILVLLVIIGGLAIYVVGYIVTYAK